MNIFSLERERKTCGAGHVERGECIRNTNEPGLLLSWLLSSFRTRKWKKTKWHWTYFCPFCCGATPEPTFTGHGQLFQLDGMRKKTLVQSAGLHKLEEDKRKRAKHKRFTPLLLEHGCSFLLYYFVYCWSPLLSISVVRTASFHAIFCASYISRFTNIQHKLYFAVPMNEWACILFERWNMYLSFLTNKRKFVFYCVVNVINSSRQDTWPALGSEEWEIWDFCLCDVLFSTCCFDNPHL